MQSCLNQTGGEEAAVVTLAIRLRRGFRWRRIRLVHVHEPPSRALWIPAAASSALRGGVCFGFQQDPRSWFRS